MRRRASALLAMACAAWTSLGLEPLPWADDTERASVRAELGVEYDTNAQRTEQVDNTNPAIVQSPLARGVVTGQLSDQVATGQAIAVSVTLGGKLFSKPEARTEDVGIVSTAAQWRARLNERFNLSLAGAYYEAFQRDTMAATTIINQRGDFRSLAPTARLARWSGSRKISKSDVIRALIDHAGPIETADDLIEWINASEGRGLGLAQKKA